MTMNQKANGGKSMTRDEATAKAGAGIGSRIVIISEPGAILRVELIELSGEERESLTANVRIPNATQSNADEASIAPVAASD